MTAICWLVVLYTRHRPTNDNAICLPYTSDVPCTSLEGLGSRRLRRGKQSNQVRAQSHPQPPSLPLPRRRGHTVHHLRLSLSSPRPHLHAAAAKVAAKSATSALSISAYENKATACICPTTISAEAKRRAFQAFEDRTRPVHRDTDAAGKPLPTGTNQLARASAPSDPDLCGDGDDDQGDQPSIPKSPKGPLAGP